MSRPELKTDAELLREAFERQASDSFGFKRSRKGVYINPAVARDWKWFQAGAAHAASESAALELLEACRAVVEAFDALPPSDPARCSKLRINKLRAAIAKATGGAA